VKHIFKAIIKELEKFKHIMDKDELGLLFRVELEIKKHYDEVAEE
jgi:hypothetical protein